MAYKMAPIGSDISIYLPQFFFGNDSNLYHRLADATLVFQKPSCQLELPLGDFARLYEALTQAVFSTVASGEYHETVVEIERSNRTLGDELKISAELPAGDLLEDIGKWNVYQRTDESIRRAPAVDEREPFFG